MSVSSSSTLINLLNSTFAGRVRPNVLSISKELSDHELQDLTLFSQFNRDDLSGEILEKYFEVFSFLAPDAFCYYMAGVIRVSLMEIQADLIVVSNIIATLDRTPNIDYWDDNFLERWSRFSVTEYEVIEEWIIWLASVSQGSGFDNSYERALDTVSLLNANFGKN